MFPTAIAGFLLCVVILHDAFETMLLPRRVKRRLRLVRLFFLATWTPWSAVARRIAPGSRRDGMLSLYGPLSLVLLEAFWVSGLILGFSLLLWASETNNGHSLLHELYASGITFFTVGFGDASPASRAARALAVIEAGVGLGFIAVVIGYLPVLYQLFSRREAAVMILDARAGSPPTATALLCRHSEGQSLQSLESLLSSWERWSADLLESHLSYPMLSYFRSQHDNQSWLAALAAIMDSCALILVEIKDIRTFQARMTFGMARLSIVELGRVFRLKPIATGQDRLAPDEFQRLLGALLRSGLEFSDPPNAYIRLQQFRATYEPYLNGLAAHLIVNLPPWLPPADQREQDNWENSPRGKSAKRLVDSAAAKPG